MGIVREAIARLRRGDAGQGMVEYALILAFIAILVIVALQFLQPAISTTLNTVSNSL
jgi:pilus assembly protein Flp/PilA